MTSFAPPDAVGTMIVTGRAGDAGTGAMGSEKT